MDFYFVQFLNTSPSASNTAYARTRQVTDYEHRSPPIWKGTREFISIFPGTTRPLSSPQKTGSRDMSRGMSRDAASTRQH